MTWTVKRSRHVIRDRWISLRADDCVSARGVAIEPYYVLEYPDFVHTLAIDREGCVVLVEQYRHGLGGPSLELPGGMMDQEDADPVAAAVRELREETGYVGASAELVATLSVDPAKLTNRLHLVTVLEAEPLHPTAFDAGEDITVVRLPVDEVIRRAMAGGIKNAAHVGLLWMGLRRLGLPGAAVG